MRTLKLTAQCLAASCILLWSATAAAQQTPSQLGIFAGVTDFERGGTEFTIGAEYDHRSAGPMSVGGLVEYTPDGIAGRSSTLLLGTLNYRPPGTPRLKFTGGAGVDFNDFGDDVRMRVGVGYDAITGPTKLTPRIAFDFGNGRQNVVLGATVSFAM